GGRGFGGGGGVVLGGRTAAVRRQPGGSAAAGVLVGERVVGQQLRQHGDEQTHRHDTGETTGPERRTGAAPAGRPLRGPSTGRWAGVGPRAGQGGSARRWLIRAVAGGGRVCRWAQPGACPERGVLGD